MPRPPVPGEAPLHPHVTSMVVVENATLATLSDEVHLDAVIDTGATLCVVPPLFARALGFDYSNRLGGGPVKVIGGGYVEMDIHRLEWVKVGSAKAYDVRIGVANTFAESLRMLVGLTFIKQFRTTFDFDRHCVIFRSG